MAWGYHFIYFRCSGSSLGAEGLTGFRVKVVKGSGGFRFEGAQVWALGQA